MPHLSFQVTGAAAVPFAMSPTLALKLRVANAPADERIHAVILRCQVQIVAPGRAFTPGEQLRLGELFGEPARWARTLHNLLWAVVPTSLPAFEAGVEVDLGLPCTYDFGAATTKFLYALEGGVVPLSLQFSGTIFYAAAGAAGLQVAPIPATAEAAYDLPLQTWTDLMAEHYSAGTSVPLRRDVFDRLYRFKVARGLPTWDHVVESLLPTEAPPRPVVAPPRQA